MTSTHMEQQQHHPEVDARLAMHYLVLLVRALILLGFLLAGSSATSVPSPFLSLSTIKQS